MCNNIADIPEFEYMKSCKSSKLISDLKSDENELKLFKNLIKWYCYRIKLCFKLALFKLSV